MEENKVVDKLVAIMRKTLAEYGRGEPGAYTYAQAISESPDLRVTIREPRFRVRKTEDLQPVYHEAYSVYDSRSQQLHCALFFSATDARIYADFLNSKEPK